MISEQHVEKYRALYRKHFGQDISHEEARRQDEQLIRFVKAVRGWQTEKIKRSANV